MGCNTSKESVPQEDNKENQDDGVEKKGEKREIKLSDNKAEIIDNHLQEAADSKPASAKTVTLRSNGSATVTIQEHNKDDTKQSNAVASEQDEAINKDDPEEEEKAATKIQAVFRGHKTRKSMKQPTGKVEPTTAASQEPTREELEAEFRLDDAELCNAATKIQATFRGHMIRKQEGKKDDEESSSSQAKAQEEEELDIDLTDPELNKAAVKIQASFRGHMTRKDEKPIEEHK